MTEGDQRILSFLPLAGDRALSFSRRLNGIIPFDDLFQYACIGLIRAESTFTGESPYAAYASLCVTWEICNGIRSETNSGRARRAGVTFHPLTEAIAETYPDHSFSPRAMNDRVDLEILSRRMRAREARIINAYYLDEETWAQIAASEGLSEARIAQLIAQGLKRMRPQ